MILFTDFRPLSVFVSLFSSCGASVRAPQYLVLSSGLQQQDKRLKRRKRRRKATKKNTHKKKTTTTREQASKRAWRIGGDSMLIRAEFERQT